MASSGRKPQNNKTSKRNLEAAELRLLVLKMRREGATYSEIAKKLSRSKSSIYKHVKVAIQEYIKQHVEDVEELKKFDFEITQALLEEWFPLAMNKDVEAANFVDKILKRRAAYYGLDAPKTANVNVSGAMGITGPLPGTREALLAEIQRRLAATPPSVN